MNQRAFANHPLPTNLRQRASADDPLLATLDQQPAANNPLPTTPFQQPPANDPWPTTLCQRPSANDPLSSTLCQRPSTSELLPMISCIRLYAPTILLLQHNDMPPGSLSFREEHPIKLITTRRAFSLLFAHSTLLAPPPYFDGHRHRLSLSLPVTHVLRGAKGWRRHTPHPLCASKSWHWKMAG